MKNLKLLILLCGGALLGLYISNGLDLTENTADTVIFLLAYGIPALVGVAAMMKPPAEAWHGAIALAGFGVAAVRSKVWATLPHLGAQDGKGKAMVILVLVGVVVSAAAMLKPERNS